MCYFLGNFCYPLAYIYFVISTPLIELCAFLCVSGLNKKAGFRILLVCMRFDWCSPGRGRESNHSSSQVPVSRKSAHGIIPLPLTSLWMPVRVAMTCFSGRRREEQCISLGCVNVTCDHKSKGKKLVSVSKGEVKAERASPRVSTLKIREMMHPGNLSGEVQALPGWQSCTSDCLQETINGYYIHSHANPSCYMLHFAASHSEAETSFITWESRHQNHEVGLERSDENWGCLRIRPWVPGPWPLTPFSICEKHRDLWEWQGLVGTHCSLDRSNQNSGSSSTTTKTNWMRFHISMHIIYSMNFQDG